MAVEYTPIKISGLPAGSALSDSDLFPITQAGITKKVTAAAIQSYMGLGGGSGDGTIIVQDVSSAGTLALDAGAFVQAIIITGSTGAVKVGTTLSGGEIIDDTITTGTPLIYPSLGVFSTSSQTLHFTGTFKIRLILWAIGE